MAPCMGFMPNHREAGGPETWWFFTPQVLQEMAGCLGFERSRVSYHEQLYNGRPHAMYTVVAERTRPLPKRLDGSYPWF